MPREGDASERYQISDKCVEQSPSSNLEGSMLMKILSWDVWMIPVPHFKQKEQQNCSPIVTGVKFFAC